MPRQEQSGFGLNDIRDDDSTAKAVTKSAPKCLCSSDLRDAWRPGSAGLSEGARSVATTIWWRSAVWIMLALLNCFLPTHCARSGRWHR